MVETRKKSVGKKKNRGGIRESAHIYWGWRRALVVFLQRLNGWQHSESKETCRKCLLSVMRSYRSTLRLNCSPSHTVKETHTAQPTPFQLQSADTHKRPDNDCSGLFLSSVLTVKGLLYTEDQSFWPVVRIGSPPYPQECMSPLFFPEGGAKPACGWGSGRTQFGRLDRKPGILSTLWF